MDQNPDSLKKEHGSESGSLKIKKDKSTSTCMIFLLLNSATAKITRLYNEKSKKSFELKFRFFN